MKAKKYLTTKEWGDAQTPPCSARRVQALVREGRIEGAIRPQRDIMIPEDAKDPRLPHGRQFLNAQTIKRTMKE